MQIGYPKKEDRERIRFLWKYCFGDSDTFLDYFFEKYYKEENTPCIIEDGKIVSDLMIFPHSIMNNGKEIKAAYIAGVVTDPIYRGSGKITALISYLEERLRNEGYDAYFLIPFNFSFYRKYGLECASYLFEYSGDILSIPKFFVSYKEGGDKKAIYESFCKDKPLYLVRDKVCEEDFLSDVKNEGGFEFVCEDAYMYYYLQNDTFYAQEMVASSKEGAERALSFIKSHSAQVKKFVVRSDFSLSDMLCEKDIEIKMKPHVMVKYLNGDKVKADMNAYFNMIGWV